MKQLIALAAVGFILVGCTEREEFVATPEQSEITFSMATPATTRAELNGADAAAKLNNKFVVYGWKTVSSIKSDVFKNYCVTYKTGSANSSTTNTDGWDYVDNTSEPVGGTGIKQSVKYWDYNASQYDFLAWSCTGSTNLKEIKTLDADGMKEGTTDNFYKEKALYFEPTSASDAATIFIANQETIEKKSYKTAVKFTFRNLATKVRLGIYETIPGYSVKDLKFYTDATTVASDGKAYLFSIADNFITTGTTTVKFRASDGYAVVFTGATTTSTTASLGTFAPAAEAEYRESGSDYLGRTSDAASLVDWQNMYPTTCIQDLNLKVDYTLVANDGGGETITVKAATATVPVQYADWKANHAYTYIFKISDNSNGTPGTPGDDPAGLYPITFDAIVTAEDGKTQETVTTVSEPSITTYQNGSEVTADGAYSAGDIYYTATKANVLQDVDASKVYEVYNTGSASLTEGLVKNYANNDVTLIAVENEEATSFDNLTFAAKKCRKFTAVTGKTYAINCGDVWKLVKIAGTYAAPTFAWTVNTAEITTTTGKAKVTLKAGSAAVVGAKNQLQVIRGGTDDVTNDFTITEETEGVFELQLTTKAIADGAVGVYAVKYNGLTSGNITVNIAYSLTPSKITITAGNETGASTVLKIDGTETDGTVVNTNEGLTIEKTATGTYKVTAAADCAHDTYTLTIGRETLTVIVDSYAFTETAVNLTKTDASVTKDIVLQKNGEASTIDAASITGAGSGLTIGNKNATADGNYTLTATATGTWTLKYENATCVVTVNE